MTREGDERGFAKAAKRATLGSGERRPVKGLPGRLLAQPGERQQML
jgi:hypothetical protein